MDLACGVYCVAHINHQQESHMGAESTPETYDPITAGDGQEQDTEGTEGTDAPETETPAEDTPSEDKPAEDEPSTDEPAPAAAPDVEINVDNGD